GIEEGADREEARTSQARRGEDQLLVGLFQSALGVGVVESAHSVALEDIGPFDSAAFSAVVEVPLVPSGTQPEPETRTDAPGEGEAVAAQDAGAEASVAASKSQMDLKDLWVASSYEREAADEFEEVAGEVEEGAVIEEVADEVEEVPVEDVTAPGPRPSPASSVAETAQPEHDDPERLSRSSSSDILEVDKRSAGGTAGPPPERRRPDTQGILAQTVWRDPEAQGLREELHGGYYFPDESEDLTHEGPGADEEQLPHWDEEIDPPKNLFVRMSASFIVLPRLRLSAEQPQHAGSAARSGFVPSIEVVEEHSDEGGSMLVIKDVDKGSTTPNVFLSPLLPGPELSASSERTSRVEFSSTLGVEFGEAPAEVPEEDADGPASAVSEETTEAEEEAEEGAGAAATASDTTALQTQLEIEEEVASLRAEILEAEASPSTTAPSAMAVRQYEVAVRAPADDAAGGAKDDVVVEFSTSTGRLFSKVYKLYANMLEVKEDLAAFFCCPVADVALETSVVDMDDSLPLAGAGVESQEVRLRIRVSRRAKPFLGGYRDSRSGTEFHHAESQTGPPAPSRDVSRTSRDAQTVRTRRRRVHTQPEKATQ
ncbi:IQ and ubiquitin-like domain-containing protein, partial [Frankliniella fusca]